MEQPGTSGEASALTIDGVPIPDGVDPSFLEALPEAIRREVLAEQLGLHPPPPSQRNATANENEASTDLNVSPEFLAALPPDVQEEVCLLFLPSFCKTVKNADLLPPSPTAMVLVQNMYCTELKQQPRRQLRNGNLESEFTPFQASVC